MIAWPSTNTWLRWSLSLTLTVTACGCATFSDKQTTKVEIPPADIDPASKRNVQVVGLETTSPDGQTSWIIEPDVRRTPKVAGLDPQLPPHIERRLNYAFDLAQRGATYSAATEFQAVLGLCALELDSRDGQTKHRDALRQGLIALDEADQFGGEQVDWRDSADVRQIAVAHSTPVLNGQDHKSQTAVDSIQAVQAYYAFAEDRMSYACLGLPGASLAYYGLGRTIAVPGTHVPHSAGKAALFHRVALKISPQNVLAGNELGVLLAKHGQLDEAERLLEQCVAIQPSPQTYKNLAVIYARQGDHTSSQAAAAAGETLAAHKVRSAAGPQTAVASQTAKSESEIAQPEAKADSSKKFRFANQLPKIFHR